MIWNNHMISTKQNRKRTVSIALRFLLDSSLHYIFLLFYIPYIITFLFTLIFPLKKAKKRNPEIHKKEVSCFLHFQVFWRFLWNKLWRQKNLKQKIYIYTHMYKLVKGDEILINLRLKRKHGLMWLKKKLGKKRMEKAYKGKRRKGFWGVQKNIKISYFHKNGVDRKLK